MIAYKTFREVWPLLLIYVVVFELILLPTIYFWPDIYDWMQKTASPVKASFFDRMWNAMRNTVPETAYKNYFAVEQFFRGVNVFGSAAAVLVGVGAIARERENHTLEFLLARPVSRSRILFAKFWVLALGVVVPIYLVTWSAIPLSAWLIEEELPFKQLTIAATHGSLFVLCMLVLTMLCSVIFRTQTYTAAAVGVFIVFHVALYFVPTIRDYSFFKLSDYDVYGPTIMGNKSFAQLFTSMEIWMIAGIVIAYVTTDRLLQRIDL